MAACCLSEGGLVGGDQSRPGRSHNGASSLEEKYGPLGFSVCGDRGRTCSSFFLAGT